MTFTLWGSNSNIFGRTGDHWNRSTGTSYNGNSLFVADETTASTYNGTGSDTYNFVISAEDVLGNVQTSTIALATTTMVQPFKASVSAQLYAQPTAGVPTFTGSVVWWQANTANPATYDLKFEALTFNAANVTTATPAVTLSGSVQTLFSGIANPNSVQYDWSGDTLVIGYGVSNGSTQTIYMRSFNTSGTALSPLTLVQSNVALGAPWNIEHNSSDVFAYHYAAPVAGGTQDVYYQTFNTTTGVLGAAHLEFATNYTTLYSYYKEGTGDGTGNAMTIIEGLNASGHALTAELLNSSDVLISTPISFNISDTGAIHWQIAKASNGNTVLVYNDNNQVHVEQFAANGTQIGSDVVLIGLTSFDHLGTLSDGRVQVNYSVPGAGTNETEVHSLILDTRTAGQTFTGTAGNDLIAGTPFADTIVGSLGNDKINGGPGVNEVSYAGLSTGIVASVQNGSGFVLKGAATDLLTNIQDIIGSAFDDVFYADSAESIDGGAGVNTLVELTSNATVTLNTAQYANIQQVEFYGTTVGGTVDATGSTQFNTLYGGTSGNFTLKSGQHGAWLIAEGGANTLIGGATGTNADIFVGGHGTSTMNGGTGYEYFYAASGDTVNGNASAALNYEITLSANMTVNLAASNLTAVALTGAGTSTADATGVSKFVTLYGGVGGTYTLKTGSGGGYMIAEGGSVTETGQAVAGNSDIFVGGHGSNATMTGGSGLNYYYIDGNDTVHGAGQVNHVIALTNSQALTIGTNFSDIQQIDLLGGSNSVDLTAQTGYIYVFGGAGNDTITAGHDGTGNEIFAGRGGTNVFAFQNNWGTDAISDWSAGSNNVIDMTALAAQGVHSMTQLQISQAGGATYISHAGFGASTDTLRLDGFTGALTAANFKFAADTTVPTETVGGPYSGPENSPILLTGLSISASPNTNDALTTVLSVAHGTVTVGSAVGVVISNNGTASVSLNGTAAAITTALSTAAYAGAANYYGADTLTLTSTDTVNANQTTKTAAITIADTTTPAESVGGPYSGLENAPIALTGLSVSASPNVGDALTTVLSAVHGTITVTSTGGVVVSNNGTASVSLNGTAAAITTALSTAAYAGAANYYGADTLTLTTTDTVDGNHATKTAALAISDTTVPAVSVGGPYSGPENTAIALAGLSVSASPNASDALTTVLAVTHGTIMVGSAGGVVVSNNGTASVSVTGTAAAITTALSTASYLAAANYTGTDTLTLATTDTVDGNQASKTAAISIANQTGTPGTPTLIQDVVSSANPVGVGIPGNNFKIPLPNAVGAGNALILAMTYPAGSNPTITDSNGNVWSTTAVVSANAGSGGNVSSIWVLPNAHAGATTLTVSFASQVIPFNYTLSEFDNVATVLPVDGTSATAAKSGGALTTGTLTPGNNDANGGNLIYNYYGLAGGANGNPTKWISGGSFTLLDGDIAWNTNQGFPHASQYFVQTSAAPINPSITAAGDTTDAFNGIAVSLKAAQAGTPAPTGIHINKIITQTSNVPPTTTWAMQVPTTGNLLVMATANSSILTDITSITDSDGGVWTNVEPSPDEPQIWYSANRTPDPNLIVTLHIGGSSFTPTMTAQFYDIAGAAASPFDVSAGGTSTDVSNQSTINNFPSITPTTANGLVIAALGDGDGPVTGLAPGSPPGAVFDYVTYSGEIDLDLMANADGQASLYNTTTATENWNWSLTANSNNSVSATAVAFKAASPASAAAATASLVTTPSSPTAGALSATAAVTTINTGQTIELSGASSENIHFSDGSAEVLQLDTATGYAGLISGFGSGDTVDLFDVKYGPGMTLGYQPNTSGPAGGSLTIGSAHLALLGSYMASAFAASSDGHGGTLINEPLQTLSQPPVLGSFGARW